MSLEEHVLKYVVDEFCRRVVIALYFVAYHLNLLVDFCLWIETVEDDVRQQVYGLCRMVFEYGGIIYGVFLVGEGIYVSSECFKAIDDVPCAPAFCTFECSVFAKMGHALFSIKFVACSGIDAETAINHW